MRQKPEACPAEHSEDGVTRLGNEGGAERGKAFPLLQISLPFGQNIKPMKKTISFSVLLASAFLLFTAAKCGKDKYQYTEESAIEIVRTPCFGSCPSYSFNIKGNGAAAFEGKQFVELEGKYARTFPPDTANYIFDTFIEANLWQYENEYTEQVTDLPTTYLSFKHAGKTKRIKLYYGFPEELETLADKLQELAFSPGWGKE